MNLIIEKKVSKVKDVSEKYALYAMMNIAVKSKKNNDPNEKKNNQVLDIDKKNSNYSW
ncbi:hypothetical protein [Gudongella oleilytica]|uniref:hypothetical protein n=1 Tax=Gudongella oleilytica TaxID=1582259 RepID=UPI002A363653|nr:hypothetical protein [Gudongella oleilytica]MDY0256015.1 hypothetical protein [Gudongella oleilytica]